MSCIVLVFELADKNVMEELGVFIDGKVQGYSFRPLKKYKPTKYAVWLQGTCTELCETVDVWITVSFTTFFLQM